MDSWEHTWLKVSTVVKPLLGLMPRAFLHLTMCVAGFGESVLV